MNVHRVVSGVLCLLVALGGRAAAQDATATVRVVVRSAGDPVAGARVRSGAVAAATDEQGMAVLALRSGSHTIEVERIGFAEATVRVAVRAGADTTVVVHLELEAVETEEILVQSTRTNRRIEDEPVRVEVLSREEIEEKLLMTPGDIAMLLNETSGLRVQTTSPSLGGANVRMQGLRGRYTQVLSDGLPLYGGQTGALGMLQIPPMDLGQVEVIKGVASALYGSSALGGVVNLISRQPAGDRELLLNRTTRGGTDAVAWSSGELAGRWDYTLLASGHRQSRHDVDGDDWADLPGYTRLVARPRVFWSDGAGRSVFATLGGTIESREGGTMEGGTTPGGTGYREALDTRRVDAGLVGRILLADDRLLSVRASGVAQRHHHGYGPVQERDLHSTSFIELALTGEDGAHVWVAGAAFQYEGYRSRDVPRFDYDHATPSIFVQSELAPTDWMTLAASARLDAHGEYGVFLNPRLSLLLRSRGGWTARASAGTGYFAPTPFTEETEVLGLTRVEPLTGLVAERGRSASLDLGRALGPFELNATFFGSQVTDPVAVARIGGGRVALVNASEPTRTWGADLLVRYHDEPLHVTATYTFTRSSEADPDAEGRRDVPLTPRHAAGIVGMWEAEEAGRIGVELYYTGRQQLEENPFRTDSRDYLVVGVLAERRIGRVRVFVNAENLLDARQTRHDPLLRPAPTPEGRWTTDVWAPLEGRTFNAGVRLDL